MATLVDEAVRLTLAHDGSIQLNGRPLGAEEARQLHRQLGVMIRAAEALGLDDPMSREELDFAPELPG